MKVLIKETSEIREIPATNLTVLENLGIVAIENLMTIIDKFDCVRDETLRNKGISAKASLPDFMRAATILRNLQAIEELMQIKCLSNDPEKVHAVAVASAKGVKVESLHTSMINAILENF